MERKPRSARFTIVVVFAAVAIYLAFIAAVIYWVANTHFVILGKPVDSVVVLVGFVIAVMVALYLIAQYTRIREDRNRRRDN